MNATEIRIRAMGLEKAAQICDDLAAKMDSTLNGQCGEWVYGEVARECAAHIRQMRDRTFAQIAAEDPSSAEAQPTTIERRIYRNTAEWQQYLRARFSDKTSNSFEFDGHRWMYQYTSFDDQGDYDLIFRRDAAPQYSQSIGQPVSGAVTDEKIIETVREIVERDGYDVQDNHQSGLVEAVTIATVRALQSTPAQAPQCSHRLIDARNAVIESGYMCVDCGTVFKAADHSST